MLTHYYKRHSGGVDATASGPVTASDVVGLLHATMTRRTTQQEPPEGVDATVARLAQLRDAAAARRAHGGG